MLARLTLAATVALECWRILLAAATIWKKANATLLGPHIAVALCTVSNGMTFVRSLLLYSVNYKKRN